MYHSWHLHSFTTVFLLLVEPSLAESDRPHRLQCATKPQDNCQENLNKVRTEPWQHAWRNLHDVSHTYASTICRGDFVVVFSVAFSVVFSVASPWCYLPSWGRFVVFGLSSSHPSSISDFHPFYWSACNQDCLRGFRRSVSACAHGSTTISWIEPSVAY